MLKSPCVAACKNKGGICQGCNRTMDEIVKWQQVSDEERDAIIDQLKGEKTTHTCPSCGEPAHCDISAGKSHCWCFDIERRELPESASSHQLCYCRKCLSKLPEL